jgi:hypothetical protein
MGEFSANEVIDIGTIQDLTTNHLDQGGEMKGHAVLNP